MLKQSQPVKSKKAPGIFLKVKSCALLSLSFSLTPLPCQAAKKNAGDILRITYEVDRNEVIETKVLKTRWSALCKQFSLSSLAKKTKGETAAFDEVRCGAKGKNQDSINPRDLLVALSLGKEKSTLSFSYGLTPDIAFLKIESLSGYDFLDLLAQSPSYWKKLLVLVYDRLPFHSKPSKASVLQMKSKPNFPLPSPIADCSRVAIFTLDLTSEREGKTGLQPMAWAFASPVNPRQGTKTQAIPFKQVKPKMDLKRHYLRCLDRIDFSPSTLANLESEFWRSRNSRSPLFSEQLNAELVGFSDRFNGGYLGIRYGFSLGSSPQVSQSKYIGINYDQRKGLLRGVRLSYDRWSASTYNFSDLEASSQLGGQRLTLGWSFAMPFDFIISRIDFIPSFGIWDYQASYPYIDYDDVITQLDFSVSRAPSADFSFGIESTTRFYNARLWAGRALNLFASRNKPSLSSYRGGLDLVFPTFTMTRYFESALILFYGLEKVSLNRAVDDLLNSSDAIISTVNFNYGFAGIGVGMKW